MRGHEGVPAEITSSYWSGTLSPVFAHCADSGIDFTVSCSFTWSHHLYKAGITSRLGFSFAPWTHLEIFIAIFIGCQCWREVDKQLDAGASWEFHWVLYLAFGSFALLMHLVANQEKKRFKSPVYFSLLTPGVPDRVCRSADHLLNVLLPPPLHLLPEVWLHQQQAVGCTVSVILQGSFAMWLQCISHNPRLCTDAPTLSCPPLNMTNSCAAYCCVDTKSGPSVTAHSEEQCMNHS